MSSAADTAELVAAYQSEFILNIIECVLCTFLVYDWLLSLDEEIHYVWPKAKSGASVLYLLNRYVQIVLALLAWTQITSDEVQCDELDKYSFGAHYGSCSCCVLLSTGVCSYTSKQMVIRECASSRLDALLHEYGQLVSAEGHESPTTSWVCFNIADITTALSEWLAHHCFNPLSGLIACLGVLIARTPLILSDLMVVIITWTKLFSDYQSASDVTTKVTLYKVMMRDGTLYFVLLLIMNILQVIFIALSLDITITETGAAESSYVLKFLDPLAALLICHFILNLRAANDPSSTSINSSFVEGELQFAQQQELINSLDGPVHTFSDPHPGSVEQIEMEEMGPVEEGAEVEA
ncbi:hypothetical protein NUW54_g3795 [Trametes sanguinea]|uniref:Uncharacterized protein n=1 Tax=Trametes sanguinea TaxID=158606 RepID=A0ACC1Q1E0_9APHY|nr:hypothetical protein NUW54_g3795 [Trametes sanguinea]